MHFNKVELCAIACHPSHDFNKEGVLIFLERQDGFFRRSDKVFVERWCRLRGNLLFYFKSKDYCSDPVGVLVLENFQIVEEKVENYPYSFTLLYQESSHILSALNAKEKASWISLIQKASMTYMKSQINNLLRLIGNFQNNHPISIEKYRMETGASIDLCKPPFFEMSISCDNLRCDSNGVPPNPRVTIYISKSPYKSWILYFQTEVLEKTSNPLFLTTVTFRHCDGIDSDTKLCFIASDVKEKVSDTYSHLGKTMTTVQPLLEASRMRLFLLSPQKHTIGFITLTTWLVASDSKDVKSKFCHATPKHYPVSESPKPIGHRRTQSLPPKLNCKVKQPSQGSLTYIYENPIVSTFRFHSGLGGDISVIEIMAEPYLCYKFPQQLLRLWITEEELQLEEISSLGELTEKWKLRQTALLQQHSTLINIYESCLSNMEENFNAGICYRKSAEKDESALEFAPINLHIQRLFAQNESLRRSKFYDIITVGAFSANSLGFKKGGLSDLLREQLQLTLSHSHNNGSSKNDCKAKLCEDAIDNLRRLRKEIILNLRLLLNSLQKGGGVSLLSIHEKLQEKTNLLLHVLDPSLIEEAFEFLDKIRVPHNPPHPLTIASRCTQNDLIKGYTSPDQALDMELASPVIHDVFDKTDHSHKLLEDFSGEKGNSYKTRLEEGLSEFTVNSCYKSTDEPEPWDLIQLNIKASLICLSSKIKYFSEILSSQDYETVISSSSKDDEEAAAAAVKTPSKGYLETSFDDDFPQSLNRETLNPHKLTINAVTPDLSPCDDSGIVVDRDKLEEESLLNLPGTPVNESLSEKPLQRTKNLNNDWSVEVKPSIRKLRQAIDGLMRTARLTQSVFKLKEIPHNSSYNHSLKYRRDICFSQALTALVTGLLTKIWCKKVDANFVEILTKIGPLALFEGLLTCYRAEAGRLADMIVAVEDISKVDFVMVPAGVFSQNDYNANCSSSNIGAGPFQHMKIPLPRVTGTRKGMRIILPVPEQMLSYIPCTVSGRPSDPPTFRVTPVFFNIGINEEATLAAKLNKDGGQYRNNHNSFERLSSYYNRFKAIFPVEEDQRRNTLSSPFHGRRKESLHVLIGQLHKEVLKHESKNVSVLHIAANICKCMDGIRFTSCKSAKDRTAMSVTLEEVNFLQEEFDLSQTELKVALDCLRSEGTRLKNCEKNVGRPKYAFSSLQLALFPPKYRPPSGTYGSNPT
ncbi:UNVERIFIED_CONTAM: hypothetical protein RMT77_006438 [Armadillidium vulgare]